MILGKKGQRTGNGRGAYVYLLARSGSAVKDQILYVPTRLEDIEELAVPLTMNGNTYLDKMRFFSVRIANKNETVSFCYIHV